MRICTSCVTPETAESISFNDKNSCSVCKQIKHKKKNRLEKKRFAF